MTKVLFITGTDTNIGKTLVSCALMQAANRAGYRVVGYKPVASGCKMTKDGPRSDDALNLMAHSSVAVTYSQVNPLAFIEPTSPDIASIKEQKPIFADELSAGLVSLKSITDWLIIEGVGGWLTPLGKSFYYSDWVASESIPVILVVGMKLGCINHALLTALAIRQVGVSLVGWVANYHTPIISSMNECLISIKDRLAIPLIGKIPWNKTLETVDISNCLDLSLL